MPEPGGEETILLEHYAQVGLLYSFGYQAETLIGLSNVLKRFNKD